MTDMVIGWDAAAIIIAAIIGVGGVIVTAIVTWRGNKKEVAATPTSCVHHEGISEMCANIKEDIKELTADQTRIWNEIKDVRNESLSVIRESTVETRKMLDDMRQEMRTFCETVQIAIRHKD